MRAAFAPAPAAAAAHSTHPTPAPSTKHPFQSKVSVKGSTVKASAPEIAGSPDVPHPLRIPALSRIAYFEPRQGFNFMAYLKTPYGLMLAFALFSVVIMPMLKVDPEEYKEMVEERKKLGASVTAAITGGGGGARRDRRD